MLTEGSIVYGFYHKTPFSGVVSEISKCNEIRAESNIVNIMIKLPNQISVVSPHGTRLDLERIFIQGFNPATLHHYSSKVVPPWEISRIIP